MPELPEVETVRLGLVPALVGNRFGAVEQRRADLRFPLPSHFAERLSGRRIEALDRRAKYLLARLDDGAVLVMHLGMTGRFSIDRANGEPLAPRVLAHAPPQAPRHEHLVFHMQDGTAIRYADARRFGYMLLIPGAELAEHPLFKGLGFEPMSDDFTADALATKLAGKTAPLKAALLDQRLIAGLGNIYACEALYAARLSPMRRAGTIVSKTGKPTALTERLVAAIKQVLRDAIEAGGSSLRDYVQADGRLGTFQHSFKVYGREGKPCPGQDCRGTVKSIVQSGRSTFYCPSCQR
jgi:formamidopyrimidine-DNA glycosylase